MYHFLSAIRKWIHVNHLRYIGLSDLKVWVNVYLYAIFINQMRHKVVMIISLNTVIHYHIVMVGLHCTCIMYSNAMMVSYVWLKRLFPIVAF